MDIFREQWTHSGFTWRVSLKRRFSHCQRYDNVREKKKTCPHFEKSATSWTVDCVKLVDDFSTVTSNQSHRFCCELLNVLISQIQSNAKVKTLHCYITTRAKHGTHWTNSKTGFFPLVNNKLPSRGRETESVQMCLGFSKGTIKHG